MADPFVNYMFETPLIEAELPDADFIGRQLGGAIAERRASGAGSAGAAGDGLWESDGMVDWVGDAVLPLIEHAVALAERFTEDLGAKDHARYLWFPRVSAVVLAPGGAIQPRPRPGAYWTFLYCLADGYRNSEESLGGELILEDPRMPMLLMEEPDLRFRLDEDAPLLEPEQSFRPATGRVMMYPAWLRGGVTRYRGADQQIWVVIHLLALLPPMVENDPLQTPAP